ncbi:hypothetical protein, partial [Microcoleus sp. herbarium5]
MSTALNFQAQPITVTATVAEATVTPKLGVDMSAGGKLSAPTTRPYSGGPRVSVVNSVPANLKSAAPLSLGQRLTTGALNIGSRIAGVGLGVISNLANDLIFPEPAGFGSDMVGGRPIAKATEQPKPVTTAPQPKPQPQTRTEVRSPVGREDPFAPIFDF